MTLYSLCNFLKSNLSPPPRHMRGQVRLRHRDRVAARLRAFLNKLACLVLPALRVGHGALIPREQLQLGA